MIVVPILGEAEHPSWCLRHHPGIAMHQGPADVVRDRDGIRMDAYLVSYGGLCRLSLDIAPVADATLIELDVMEATRLQASLGKMLRAS